MTDDTTGADESSAERAAATDKARVLDRATFIIQITGLVVAGVLGGLGIVTGNEVDRFVLIAIVGISLGIRTDTLGQLFGRGG